MKKWIPLSMILVISLPMMMMAQRRPGPRPSRHRPPHHKPQPPISHRPPGWGPHRPPYTRPPHFWEGHRYYTYHRYYYHPYRPYVFAPAWQAPPAGALVPSLPQGNTPIQVGDDTYYYFGGVFFLPGQNGYQVVQAPAGAIVYNLPEGCAQIKAGDLTYLQYNGDYYLPVQVDGRPAYEVVNIE